MPVTTHEGPATSSVIDFTEPHSVVMPSSEEYRKTGALPSKDDRARTEPLANEQNDQEDQPGNQDDAASSETAAASEAARSAEEQRHTEPNRIEKRWQKRERELKEARAEIARLKAQGTQPRSDSQQTSQPAAQPATQQPAAAQSTAEPKIDDVDTKTGKPRFATLHDFLSAHAKWNRDEAIREIRADSARTAQDAERAEIGKSLTEHVTKARQAHSDYDQVIDAALAEKDHDGRSPIFYTPGSHIDNFLLSQSDRGAGLLYHCCKNASDPAIRGIFARNQDGTRYLLSNLEQISRLAVLAHTLTATNGGTRRRVAAAAAQNDDQGGEDEGDDEGDDQTSERSSAKPSQAPRPPHQTSGKGSVGKDPVAEAVETGDSETYMREVNRVALARRKKGKS